MFPKSSSVNLYTCKLGDCYFKHWRFTRGFWHLILKSIPLFCFLKVNKKEKPPSVLVIYHFEKCAWFKVFFFALTCKRWVHTKTDICWILWAGTAKQMDCTSMKPFTHRNVFHNATSVWTVPQKHVQATHSVASARKTANLDFGVNAP